MREPVAAVAGGCEHARDGDYGREHQESPRAVQRRCEGRAVDLGHELLLP
jgi:hypothetical protein